MNKLTHLNEQGQAQMVDVSHKARTAREAMAMGYVTMQATTLALIESGGHKKGDVLTVARIAGIQAAKKCADLIPLCHPLSLTGITVELTCEALEQQQIYRVCIRAGCKLNGQTGVEMEALTAVSVAALTVYDMCKAVDKTMVIGDITMTAKRGGRSDTLTAN